LLIERKQCLGIAPDPVLGVIRTAMLQVRAQYALAAEVVFSRSRQGCAGFKHGEIMAAIRPNILVKMA
jgi:hypothetical protein